MVHSGLVCHAFDYDLIGWLHYRTGNFPPELSITAGEIVVAKRDNLRCHRCCIYVFYGVDA